MKLHKTKTSSLSLMTSADATTATEPPPPVRFDDISQAAQTYGDILLDKEADYTLNQMYEMDTHDREDHTFCGVMFNIQNHSKQPLEYLEIQALCVRGNLGPMTCWVTPDSFHHKHETKSEWTLVYKGTNERSRTSYCRLELQRPVRLQPGEKIGVYVHSGLHGDQGLVYDNRRGAISAQDANISVESGLAHISNTPFSPTGMWGFAWRRNRQFVGRVCYGVKYLLWQPAQSIHERFPVAFRRAVDVMLIVDYAHSMFTRLPEHVVWYIINFLPYDWVTDDGRETGNGRQRSISSSAVKILKKSYHSICRKSRACVLQ